MVRLASGPDQSVVGQVTLVPSSSLAVQGPSKHQYGRVQGGFCAWHPCTAQTQVLRKRAVLLGNTATSVLHEKRADVSNETGVVVITDNSGTCQT